MAKKKLKLKDVAAIAEVLGTVGVIISLVFVGLQIQQNTEETRASNRQSLATRAQDLALFQEK